MSHFTVMVIGPNPEKQLQPYHEYECTGIEDEYVIDVDQTQEIEGELAKEIYIGIDKETKQLDYHFSEDAATKSLVSFEKVPRSTYLERAGITVDEYVEDEHGYEKKDGKWFRKTNPNSKWDWYVLGGRWSGFLKIKQSATAKAVVGKQAFMCPPAEAGWADQAKKSDIDFEGMKSSANEKAMKRYRELEAKFGGAIPKIEFTWSQILEDQSLTIDQKREKYNSQPAIVALKSLKDEHFTDLEDFQCSVLEYGKRAADRAVSTYAVVMESKWYAKGEMGWFGMSNDTQTQENWNEEVGKILESLPDDTLISIYDCHI